MRTSIWIFSVVLLISPEPGFCRGGDSQSIDLYGGVALPANSRAVRENPARLASEGGKVFDASVGLGRSGGLDGAGRFVWGGGIGFGLEVESISSQFQLAGGFGAKASGFSIGVSAATQVSNFSPQIDLGLHQELGDLSLGLDFEGLTQFGRYWVAGLGGLLSQNFRLGVDFEFQNNGSGFGISSSVVDLHLQYFISQKVTLSARYGLTITPVMSMDTPGLGAGLSIWLSSNISGFAVYRPIRRGSLEVTYDWNLGIKFAL